VDYVAAAPNGSPKGSLDGVIFPDSTNSTVAVVTGDPTQATGSLTLGGFVFGLDYGGTHGSTSLSGSFGFLINASYGDPTSNTGVTDLGVIYLDGGGKVTGTYTLQLGATNAQAAQTQTGTFTGSYSTNADGTGNLSIDGFGTYAIVVTDKGQGLQLVDTNCALNCGSTLYSGVARAVYVGSLNGSYGFQINNYPQASSTIGVVSFDGAGNASATFTNISLGNGGDQPSVVSGTATGTYSLNSDGSGAITLSVSGSTLTFAIVVVDGGSGLLLLETDGSAGSNVSFGTARLE
jgi:hypothetical protein